MTRIDEVDHVEHEESEDVSLDRSHVQFVVKEICTKMATPTQGHWKRLEKAGRYLSGDSDVGDGTEHTTTR